MKNVFGFLLIAVSLQSCVVAYAMAMREKKMVTHEWKQEDYKVVVESWQGGFGPRYEICYVYKKDFLFYIKITEHYFSFDHDVKNGQMAFVEKGFRYFFDFTKDTMDVFH